MLISELASQMGGKTVELVCALGQDMVMSFVQWWSGDEEWRWGTAKGCDGGRSAYC